VESSELHKIHLAHRTAAERIVTLARARYSAGGNLMDFAQADVEAANVETEVVTEAENSRAARAKMNGLLLRDPDAALGPPELPETQVPDEPLEALVSRSRERRSDVRAAEARRSAESAEARVYEREASTPTFNVGALYFAPTRDTPEHAYGIALGATLPWLWGGARTAARAGRELSRASDDDVVDSAARVQTEVATAFARARAAARRFETIRDRALPAAARAEQAALAGYDSGKTSALSLFVARRAVVESEIELIRARIALGHALVDLDWAVGSPVRRRRLEPHASP